MALETTLLFADLAVLIVLAIALYLSIEAPESGAAALARIEADG